MPGVLQSQTGLVPVEINIFAAFEIVAYRHRDETTLAMIGELAGRIVEAIGNHDVTTGAAAVYDAVLYVTSRLAEART